MMTNRYAGLQIAAAEVAADCLDRRDEEIMQALVTAGALVALADGRVESVERDELVNFIDRQGFAPTISQRAVADAFDNRVQQVGKRDGADAILQAFRPLSGLSLASVVVRTAERVAAADRKIHPGELQILNLIRLMLMCLPVTRRTTALAALSCGSSK